MPEPVQLRVAMSQPHSHLYEVEVRFPASGEELLAEMAVWTPGSYLVREFSRHVQDFAARDDQARPLPFTRIDKRSFRVRAGGKPVTLRYRVYANELTVRTSHLDGTHGFFNGANLFFYVEPLRKLAHHVTVDPPARWTAFSALPREGAAFVARDFDELVDSPFEVGPHTPISFTAAGVPHQVVVWGEPAPDSAKLTADLTRVVEHEAALFGGLPLQRYLFLLYLTDKGRGGLEHMASTALLFPRFGLTNGKGWEDFLTLVAHEYFHLWNVKRIRPRALVPFDYTQEVYTQLLWAFEGVTSYYDNLVVRRAGLMPPARYLTRLGEALTALQGTPGRGVQPLSEASFNAWIKHYRPDENSPNSAISYYLKGEIVGCLLDLEIRRLTRSERSLDDVMRLLWKRYGDGAGVPEDGVEAAAAEVAGSSLQAFFDRAIRSTAELDYSVFTTVGLEPRTRIKESPNDKGGTPPRPKAGEQKPKGWLGLLPKGQAQIAAVLEGSPAMEAGLYPDDEILALDGYRVDCGSLTQRCEEKRPGEMVRIAVFRRDKWLEIPVKLGTKPADAVYLARVEQPSEEQRRAYQAWLGAPWDEPPAP